MDTFHCCAQMTNVTRQSSSAVNTELIYYVVQYLMESTMLDSKDVTVNESLLTTAHETCQLMVTVNKQQAAILLGHVVVTQCQGLSVCLSHMSADDDREQAAGGHLARSRRRHTVPRSMFITNKLLQSLARVTGAGQLGCADGAAIGLRGRTVIHL